MTLACTTAPCAALVSRPQHHALQQQRSAQVLLPHPTGAAGKRRASRRLQVQAVSAFLKGKTPWWRVPKPPNMGEVHSIQALVNELHTHRDELVVIEMYATWCAGCKALLPHLIQLAEADPSVRWLNIDYDENKPLGRGLGVTGLPTVLLFRGSDGLVESFQLKASNIQQLKDALERHGGPRPPCTAAAPLAAFPHVRPRHIAQQQQPQRLRVVALSAPTPEPSHGSASVSGSYSDGEHVEGSSSGGGGKDGSSGSGASSSSSGGGGEAVSSSSGESSRMSGGKRQIIL